VSVFTTSGLHPLGCFVGYMVSPCTTSPANSRLDCQERVLDHPLQDQQRRASFLLCLFAALLVCSAGIKPRTPHMLGKCSTTKPSPSPWGFPFCAQSPTSVCGAPASQSTHRKLFLHHLWVASCTTPPLQSPHPAASPVGSLGPHLLPASFTVDSCKLCCSHRPSNKVRTGLGMASSVLEILAASCICYSWILRVLMYTLHS
jgi:hypothetical protein